jgi:hypothetical protein
MTLQLTADVTTATEQQRPEIVVTEYNGYIVAEIDGESVKFRSTDAADTYLTEFVEAGGIVRDPHHVLDCLGILAEPYTSEAQLDADSAAVADLLPAPPASGLSHEDARALGREPELEEKYGPYFSDDIPFVV